MVPTFSQPFGAGDLRIGIASWDSGDLMIVALKQKELTVEQVERVKYHLR
jgi:hypothetical protein